MKYQVLTVSAVYGFGTDFKQAAKDLSEHVNRALLEGWKPLGGVAVGDTQSTKEPYLFQAMIHDSQLGN